LGKKVRTKLGSAANDYSQVRYALPGGVPALPPKVAQWFTEVGILPGGVEAITHLN
jgi:hypothetical protein